MSLASTQVALAVRCDTCGTGTGFWCRSRNGRVLRKLHITRRSLGKRVAQNLEPCSSCGKCCLSRPWWLGSPEGELADPPSDPDLFQFVEADPWIPRELVERLPPGRTLSGKRLPMAMRVENGQCVALVGTTCSIYDARPSVCRRFVRGSLTCRLVRGREGRETSRWWAYAST